MCQMTSLLTLLLTTFEYLPTISFNDEGFTDRSMNRSVLLCLLGLAVLLVVNAHKHVSPFERIQMHLASVRLDSSISISISPDALESNGQWVTVTWSGVSKPSKDDWIGAFSQLPFNPSSAPAKYKMCSDVSPDYIRTGSGNTTFRLVNMRSAYTFALFSGQDHPVLLATSKSVSFKNPNEVRVPRTFP